MEVMRPLATLVRTRALCSSPGRVGMSSTYWASPSTHTNTSHTHTAYCLVLVINASSPDTYLYICKIIKVRFYFTISTHDLPCRYRWNSISWHRWTNISRYFSSVELKLLNLWPLKLYLKPTEPHKFFYNLIWLEFTRKITTRGLVTIYDFLL